MIINRLWEMRRILGLTLLLVSAAAMSAYLFDRYSAPLPWGVCAFLHVAAWGSVALAWRQYRRCLRPYRDAVLIAFVILRVACAIAIVHVAVGVRNTYFPCTPSRALRQYRALISAIDTGNLAAVKTVLANDRQPDYVPSEDCREGNAFWGRPLLLAVDRDNPAVVAALLDAGSVVKVPGERNVFARAALYGNLSIMGLLLRHGASVNDYWGNSMPLWLAVQNENVEEVDFLLNHGANPQTAMYPEANGKAFSVLHLARNKGNVTIVKRLKQAGAKE